MKRLLKLVLYAVVALLLLLGGVVAYYASSWPPTFPETPTPQITASDDPDVIARGDYLFNAVAHCPVCHAAYDDVVGTKPGDKIVPRGGGEWKMGPLGTIRSPNLTDDDATGLGKWTDGQIARTIRHAIKADDEAALFMMSVGAMSDEDLTAIVSYIRTVPAVSNEVPHSEVGLLGKILFQGPMAFFSRPKDYAIPPFVKEGGVSVERGKYLFEGPAFCAGCHSAIEWDGESLQFVGQLGAGRTDPNFPDKFDPESEYVAPNLTQDPETSGIYGWTEDALLQRFRTGRQFKGSPMPWEAYALMTDDDIESLYAYLQSLPPTKNLIGPTYRKVGWKPPSE